METIPKHNRSEDLEHQAMRNRDPQETRKENHHLYGYPSLYLSKFTGGSAGSKSLQNP